DMLFGIAPVHMALLHGHREFRRLLLNRKRNPERPEVAMVCPELLRLAAERGIETELVNRRQLDELSEGRPNQGVCLEASRRDFMDAVATDDPAAGSPASETVADGGKRRLWVVINEVNDPMNLGAVLRSTYFMGVETVLITKQNSSCSLTPTVSKASAGTVEVMDIYTTGRLPQVLQEKAKQGWQIVGTVGYAKSTGSAVPVVPCDQYQLKAPTILLIG
uniref:rRNA methyltransferase 1, mitochondrial n=1 Tax=Petromyzon marinus TaxID=7757 RepID=S4R5Q8_PETMA